MKKLQSIITVLCYVAFVVMWLVIGFVGLIVSIFEDRIPTMVALIFIILAFAVITFPIYIKIPNPKKAYISIILTVSLALSAILTHTGIVYYYGNFTSAKWQKHMKLRYRMIDSLESQYTLKGMTVDEITELLGEADWKDNSENAEFYNYRAGLAFLDTVTYRVTVENGIVIDTEKQYVD